MSLFFSSLAEYNDFMTANPFEFFFESPVNETDENCLDVAVTIEIDDRLEGFEEFYVFVDSSLSTPQGVSYDESFLVIIKDNGM